MVEIPPTPDHLSQSQPHHHHHHHHHQQQQPINSSQQQQKNEVVAPKRLHLSLKVSMPEANSPGWRTSASYRHSFTLEGGRLTPSVQISELDPSSELHGLAVGDKILEVNGTTVKDKSLDEIKTLLTNDRVPVHVMLERDLSPLRLPPEEDTFAPSSPLPGQSYRNFLSDDLNSTSASEGETVVVLDQTVKLRPKGSLRARGHSPSRRRSKSPSPCPSARQKSLDLSRSHSFSTRQQDHRAFRSTDLIIGEVLGQGFFGQALKATHRVTGEQMVLKELHNFDEDAQKSFLREVSMLRSLSHPCVLKFLGVLYRDKKLNLVTEFIDGGTLSDLLLDLSIDLSWKQRIAFAKDISAGMSYLHSMNIIHRDLNSQNCLVRKDQSVVVADFGLAKIFPRRDVSLFSSLEKEADGGTGSSSTGGRKKKRFSRRKRGTVVGNPYWMAPEMMTKGVYDEKVDVFSYGIIVCEIIARVTADPDYLPRSFDFGLNVEAFHQKFCANVPEPFLMLAVLCSQIEPDQRPSFEKIHLLCEALNLHNECGMAVPTDLQGSTVEFYRSFKEKIYGQNYTDVDSCSQVDTNKCTEAVDNCPQVVVKHTDDVNVDDCSQVNVNTEVIKETSMDERSQDEKSGQNLHNVDCGEFQSSNSANNSGEIKSGSSSDGIFSGTDTSDISPVVSHSNSENGERSHSGDNLVINTTDSLTQHMSLAEAGDIKSREMCTSEKDQPSLSAPSLDTDCPTNGKLHQFKLAIDDGLCDFSAATTNEDYAYFSCSSESPSVSMSSPCLSVEDFTSCRSSPNSSRNHIVNQFTEPELHDKLSAATAINQNDDLTTDGSGKTVTKSENGTNFSDASNELSTFTNQTEPQTDLLCTENSSLSSLKHLTDSESKHFNEDESKHSNEDKPKHYEDEPNLSNEIESNNCSMAREYKSSLQLEYGANISSPPSSNSFSLANSNDYEV